MSQRTRFEGVPFELGNETYIVPGLALKQLRANVATIARIQALEQEQMANPTQEGLVEVLETAGKLVLIALQRNYPNVTAELIEDSVDTNNAKDLMQAVMGQSGYTRVKEVAAVPQGEPKASSQ